MLKWEDAEKLEKLLAEDRYDSKDWKAGSFSERVEWLISMYEAKREEVEQLCDDAIEFERMGENMSISKECPWSDA